ncbi:MAG TPA: peptidoglycan-binding protein [Acidimicrobiales bacterium]|nr:peptidoglycan-binding protein [Acidimicrobiales bacterium]
MNWDSELPLTLGAKGPAVEDLQRRLLALGFPVTLEDGVFGAETAEALRAFQRSCGLEADGVCHRSTWSRLVEAGYRPGDRLLYLRTPYLRGDDVVDLQRRLNALGFDAGRVDGIFGADTDRALRGFQRNAGLSVDGICGQKTQLMLQRLRSKGPESDPAAVREAVRLANAPATLQGRRVALGERGGTAPFLREVQHRLTAYGAIVTLLSHPDDAILAAQANAAGAEVYLGIALAPAGHACRAAYWGAHGSVSPAGRRLAGLLLDELSISGAGTDGAPVPMATPILRETRMPAVSLELGPPRFVVERAAIAAEAIGRGLSRWADGPCLDLS